MKKKSIEVPADVNYLSDWPEFRETLPQGQIILNKVFAGCGATTYFLESDEPIILCSPRIFLLDNKAEQMKQQGRNFFYYKPSKEKSEEKRKAENDTKFNELLKYIQGANPPKEFKNGKPYVPKILITYDSFPAICQKLKQNGIEMTVIVDEFHVAFQDYDMKRETIETFRSATGMMKNVIYLSATPIMEKYLDMMEPFKDLPYVELKWNDSKMKPTEINYKYMKSTKDALDKVINLYKKNGVFDTKEIDGKTYNSTEALFFVNEVKTIVECIKRNGLVASEVNILCADTDENEATIKKVLGDDYGIGKIPLKGQPHKTYTFCTKSVFFGCDFYSTCASTYVFADSNQRNMTTDIALDLPQIVFRLRLEENVFKNECTVYVNTTSSALQSEDEFLKDQKEKEELTDRICNDLSKLSQESIEAITMKRSKCPYGVIYKDVAKDCWIAKKSTNAIASEKRAWELRNKIYDSHQTVQYLMQNEGFVISSNPFLEKELGEFYSAFLNDNDTARKMKLFCDYFDTHLDDVANMGKLNKIPAEYKQYYKVLGTEVIKKQAYILSRIKPVYEAVIQKNTIQEKIDGKFSVGKQYTKSEIKEAFKAVYSELGLKKSAKATDIEEFYEVKTSTRREGKQITNCFTIEKKKDNGN